MTARPIDPVLLRALEQLDDACDARGVICELDEGIARQPGALVWLAPGVQQGEVALVVRLTPRRRAGVFASERVELRAPYSDRTAEWVRALALRIRAARSFDPRGWAHAAVADVLGTVDGSAEERDATAQMPELPQTTNEEGHDGDADR